MANDDAAKKAEEAKKAQEEHHKQALKDMRPFGNAGGNADKAPKK